MGIISPKKREEVVNKLCEYAETANFDFMLCFYLIKTAEKILKKDYNKTKVKNFMKEFEFFQIIFKENYRKTRGTALEYETPQNPGKSIPLVREGIITDLYFMLNDKYTTRDLIEFVTFASPFDLAIVNENIKAYYYYLAYMRGGKTPKELWREKDNIEMDDESVEFYDEQILLQGQLMKQRRAMLNAEEDFRPGEAKMNSKDEGRMLSTIPPVEREFEESGKAYLAHVSYRCFFIVRNIKTNQVVRMSSKVTLACPPKGIAKSWDRMFDKYKEYYSFEGTQCVGLESIEDKETGKRVKRGSKFIGAYYFNAKDEPAYTAIFHKDVLVSSLISKRLKTTDDFFRVGSSELLNDSKLEKEVKNEDEAHIVLESHIFEREYAGEEHYSTHKFVSIPNDKEEGDVVIKVYYKANKKELKDIKKELKRWSDCKGGDDE
jgi:hypothetical protein